MRTSPRRSTTTPVPYSLGTKFGSVGGGGLPIDSLRPNGSGRNSRRTESPLCSLRTRAMATTDFSAEAIVCTSAFSMAAAASRDRKAPGRAKASGQHQASPAARRKRPSIHFFVSTRFFRHFSPLVTITGRFYAKTSAESTVDEHSDSHFSLWTGIMLMSDKWQLVLQEGVARNWPASIAVDSSHQQPIQRRHSVEFVRDHEASLRSWRMYARSGRSR